MNKRKVNNFQHFGLSKKKRQRKTLIIKCIDCYYENDN